MSAVIFEPENVTWDGDAASLISGSTNDVINAGRVVYLQVNGQVAPASPSSEASAAAIGITVGSAQSDQFVSIANKETLNLQSITLEPGELYCVGPSGTIVPRGDLARGSWLTLVGVAISTSQLQIHIWPTGTQVA